MLWLWAHDRARVDSLRLCVLCLPRYLTLVEMSELVNFQLALLDPQFRLACKQQLPQLVCSHRQSKHSRCLSDHGWQIAERAELGKLRELGAVSVCWTVPGLADLDVQGQVCHSTELHCVVAMKMRRPMPSELIGYLRREHW